VVPVMQKKFSRNGTISMKLMKRPKVWCFYLEHVLHIFYKKKLKKGNLSKMVRF